MFRSIWSIGTWPGPSIITWQFRCLARRPSSPITFNSANWASSLASAIEPGRSPSPRLQVTSCSCMMSHRSSKWVKNGFCWPWAVIHFATSEPPRLTMPVKRRSHSGKCSRSTAAWIVM